MLSPTVAVPAARQRLVALPEPRALASVSKATTPLESTNGGRPMYLYFALFALLASPTRLGMVLHGSWPISGREGLTSRAFLSRFSWGIAPTRDEEWGGRVKARRIHTRVEQGPCHVMTAKVTPKIASPWLSAAEWCLIFDTQRTTATLGI